MNIEAYIESGVLESYALGQCNEGEAEDVERLCRQYPQVKAELERIQSDLELYASAHGHVPPASLKQQALKQLELLQNKPQPQSLSLTPKKNSGSGYRIGIAASVTLFIISVIANIYLYKQWQKGEEKILALNAEKTLLVLNQKNTRVKMVEMHEAMNIMSDTGTMKVMLTGVKEHTEHMAVVFWKRSTREVFLQAQNLPAPDIGMQYQLWAIVDGKPMDAGVLPMDSSEPMLMHMKDFGEADAFAITLENEGGTDTPTLARMIVMGEI